ncbi:hypothetical protein K438DRAFT_1746837 [Mycena galopus ATCC 62051]|nr:hypothetical protein K438DRAFT_1746837 [Mycena galopus ATCC 62051]
MKPFATAKAQFIVKAIFNLSGVCDVLAFKFARSGLLLFPSSTGNIKAENQDEEEPQISQNEEVPRSRWRLYLLVFFWISINALDSVWITYLYVFGFFWGCVNIIVWIWYFQSIGDSDPNRTGSGRHSTFSRGLRLLRKWGRVELLLPVAIIMGLGPFFAPVIGERLAQQAVVLNGVFYNSPDNKPAVATFYFRQSNRTLERLYDYNLIKDSNNPNIWHFVLSGSQRPTQIPSVTYYFNNFTFVVTCPGNTTQCNQGSYQEGGFLSFSIADSFNPTVLNLRAVDNGWDYG